jgi:hypothetical protein
VKANLPDDLPSFLSSISSKTESAPVVVYNTCVTGYLRDHGKDLRLHVEAWAKGHSKPVLWAQLESENHDDSQRRDHYGWAWTVDYWDERKQHHHWQIGQAHLHGYWTEWMEEDLKSFIGHFH